MSETPKRMSRRNVYPHDSFDQGGINMVSIRLTRDDLRRFFSIDADGHRLTLEHFIEREEHMHHEENVGSAALKFEPANNPEPNFSADDINELVAQYLRSMDEDEVLEIAGAESFDKQQLMREVENRSSVGVQIIEMILADRGFVEQQIKRGNYSRPA